MLVRKTWLSPPSQVLSFATWISVVGVALGVAQLLVVLAVMSGFIKVFTENYTRISSEIVVISELSEATQTVRQKIQSNPQIAAVTPAALGQGMVLKDGVAGVVLEGIDLKTSEQVTPWKDLWVEPPREDLQKQNSYWIWLGVQLAQKIRAKVGDTVEILVIEGEQRKYLPFVVTALVRFGIYEHDLRYARLDKEVLQDVFKKHQLEPFYKCKVKRGANIHKVAGSLQDSLGNMARVKAWDQVHKNIFLAVNHQKQMLFLILQIVVALSIVNIISLILMTANARIRELAIFRALGMKRKVTLALFCLQGLFIGVLGCGLGTSLGGIGNEIFKAVVPGFLSEKIYNVSKLPIEMTVQDAFLVCLSCLLLCFISSLLCAWWVTRKNSFQTLQSERGAL